MNLLKRIIAAALILCMALTLAGCGDTTWVARVDGEDVVPSGLYIYYQTEGYGAATQQLYQENSDNLIYYLYYLNYGYVEPTLFDMTLESGETVEEYINQYAMDMCKQSVVIDRLFDELGLEFTDDEKALIDSQLRNSWSSSGDSWEEIGVSQASFEKAVYAARKEEKVFDAYYEIGGLNGTTEEEIEAYFSDNYARIKYMTFQYVDSVEDAIDEARKNSQLELVNSYRDRAAAGESMDDLIDEYNAYLAEIAEEEALGEAADDGDAADDAAADDAATDGAEDTDETDGEEVSAEDGTEDEYPNEVILSKESTSPTEKFVNYVFTTCPVGEFTVIQDDTCFYLVDRLDILEREGLYEEYRDHILTDLFDADYTKLINDRLKTYSVEENARAVKRYAAKKAFPGVFD